MVSTQDSESCNPSSNLGGTFLFSLSIISPFLLIDLESQLKYEERKMDSLLGESDIPFYSFEYILFIHSIHLQTK